MTARKKATGQVYVAIDSGSAEGKDGTPYTFTRGVTRVAEGHELLKLAGNSFAPVEENVHYGDVEAATAAPGQKRG